MKAPAMPAIPAAAAVLASGDKLVRFLSWNFDSEKKASCPKFMDMALMMVGPDPFHSARTPSPRVILASASNTDR